MPLTSPAHVSNQLDVAKTNAGMQHDMNKQQSQQTHQRRQSELAGMLKNMGTKSRDGRGMATRSGRAQNGPMKTAARGQKALASSK